MFRILFAYSCLLVAIAATLLWYTQRSGRKIVFADSSINELSYLMALYQDSLNVPPNAPPTDVYTYAFAEDGNLVVHRLAEYQVDFIAAKVLGGPSKTETLRDTGHISIPLVPVLVAGYAIALFVIAAPLVRRLVRLRRGACPWCGYSLIGNTSGRCPECGRQTSRTANR